MALYDQHLHSRHSVDSKADPEANVRRAMELGLAGLTFTEHYDSHPTEWPVCLYDYDKIAATVAGLRRQFGERMFIGHGIEICYQPEQMGQQILPYLAGHRFDLVLCSVHWFDGRALHIREHWEGLDADAGTRQYLETVLQAVQFVRDLRKQGQRPFDVLGHLDLVKRYTQRYFGTFNIRPHAELVDEILRVCLQAELTPEVNLSSLRQGVSESMPADWVVKRYAELGGEAMTLGSDAHETGHVGANIHDGAALLKSAGIQYLAVFKDRQRTLEAL